LDNPNPSHVTAKVVRRLIPWLFFCYIFNYMDRLNLSFAAMTFKADLGIGDAAFGLGASVFFVGYVFLEIPSNLMLEKFGPRRWIARIMVSWGLVSSCMMFTRSETSFYALRFLLGACEAGFLPGIAYMLTHWIPERERARAFSLFLTSTTLAGVVGAPLAALILQFNGFLGLKGWQWLFLLEGIPTIVLGIATWFFLDDRIEDARWLSADEKAELRQTLETDRAAQGNHLSSLKDGLFHRRVWHMGILYFFIIISYYAMAFWLPQIIKNFSGLSNTQSTLLCSLPYLAATIGMVLVAHHSDRVNERRWHVALCCLAAALGLLGGAWLSTSHPVASFVALCLTATGIWGLMGPFWSIPPEFLKGTAAAAGLALINSLGNIGGFIGPYLVGSVKERTHGFEGGLVALAVTLLFAVGLTLALPRPRR
jgi:ACS family tartrate transporter-like MFS transporter